MAPKLLLSIGLAMGLASCAPLSAEAPLFSSMTQLEFQPIEAGRWVQPSPDCSVMPIAAPPSGTSCTSYTLRRLDSGYWQVTLTPGGASLASDTVLARAVFAPATETPRAASAPIFLAEYEMLDDPSDPGPFYAALVPVGPQPAREMFMILQVSCGDVLRDGPVPDVTEARASGPTRCMAQTQDGARAAVRRAVLENLPNIDASRLVYVGPNYTPEDGSERLIAKR